MKLSPKNLAKYHDTFQYQIYGKGNSFLLQDTMSSESVVFEEDEADKPVPLKSLEESKSINTQSDELDETHTSSAEDLGENRPVSFNNLLSNLASDNNKVPSSDEPNIDLITFDQADFQQDLIQIKKESWEKHSYQAKPKILFLGDPGNEALSGVDLDLASDYFNLLMRIVVATKIPTENFGFLTHINEGEKDLKSSPALANLISSINPDFVITLGANSFRFMTNSRSRLSSVHGKIKEIKMRVNDREVSVNVLPTFHPDYILINPKIKKTVWEDFQILMSCFS